MLVYKNILKSRHYQVYQVLINKTILASLMDLLLPWSGGKRCRQCKQEQGAGESDAAEVLTLRAKCSQALMITVERFILSPPSQKSLNPITFQVLKHQPKKRKSF